MRKRTRSQSLDLGTKSSHWPKGEIPSYVNSVLFRGFFRNSRKMKEKENWSEEKGKQKRTRRRRREVHAFGKIIFFCVFDGWKINSKKYLYALLYVGNRVMGESSDSVSIDIDMIPLGGKVIRHLYFSLMGFVNFVLFFIFYLWF